jgi:methionyl-tRNA formyltransferase
MNKLKVAFLIDKNNNWIENRIYNFQKSLKKSKFFSKVFKDYRRINNYDLVFILNFTKILNNNFLKKNKLNLVIHSSNLPEGKGFAPMQWQILKNKKYIYNSLIEAVKKVDSGKVYLKEKMFFKGNELYDDLREIQSESTIQLIKKFLKKYPNITPKKQLGKSTYFKKRNIVDSELNISKNIKSLFPLMRIANNNKWPLFFKYKNIKYILKIYKDEN